MKQFIYFRISRSLASSAGFAPRTGFASLAGIFRREPLVSGLRFVKLPMLAFALCGIALVPPAAAQPFASPQPVAVFHTGADPVGQQVADRLRDHFAQSDQYELTAEADLLLILQTVAVGDDEAAENFSAIGVVWAMRDGPGDQFPAYLESSTGFAGSERIDAAASGIVSDTGQILMQIVPRLMDARRQ
jgi:hypothetical protein